MIGHAQPTLSPDSAPRVATWPQSTAPSTVQQDDGWEFDVVPYFWFTQLSGTQRIGSVEVPVDADFEQLADDLDFAFMLHVAARKDRWGILVDTSYTKLSGEASESIFTVENGVEQFHGEIDGTWRVTETSPFEVIAGVRYTSIKNEFTLTPGPSLDSEEGWVDPVLGGRVVMPISDQWWFVWRFDYAGFRSNSNSWQTLMALRYHPLDWFSLSLAFRVLDQDYEQSDFAYDAQMSGAMLGLGFHF